jgi:hypothetical protein
MNQCKLKRQIKEFKESIGSNSIGMAAYDNQFPELVELNDSFWKGSMRHGNKRKYEAGMKVKQRKSDRMKLKEEFNEEHWS